MFRLKVAINAQYMLMYTYEHMYTFIRKQRLLIIVLSIGIVIASLILVKRNASFITHFISTKINQTQQSDETMTQIPDSIKKATYSYGTHELEALDVYATEGIKDAPIIVMVHGGAWFIGDKSNENIWKNKVAFWGPKGYIFVSVNYPMMYEGYKPDVQADAVAKALTYIQENARSWGGDPEKIVAMGHSAGAHLVALVSVTRTDTYPDLKPWSGTVLLDSAAYSLKTMMESNPEDFYIKAFGNDPTYWTKTSPNERLKTKVEPLYIVCSSNRASSDCEQADVFKTKAIGLGGTVTLRAEALSHEEINTTLGLPSEYTNAVAVFIEKVIQ